MSGAAQHEAACAALLAEKQCRDIVLAAARAVDGQDYAALVALFTDDATLVRPGGEPLQGRAAILASYASKSPDRLTCHVVSNHSVHFQGGHSGPGVDSALSQCTVQLYVADKRTPLTPRGRAAEPVVQIGQIADRLVLTPQGWRIQERRAWFDMHCTPAAAQQGA